MTRSQALRSNQRAGNASARTRLTGRATFAPPTTSAPKISDREAAQGFSAEVIGFTAKQLAAGAGRTTEAAKDWLDGSRMPNGASLINLARAFPSVRAWLYAEIERGEHFESDRMQTLVAQMVARELDKRG